MRVWLNVYKECLWWNNVEFSVVFKFILLKSLRKAIKTVKGIVVDSSWIPEFDYN